MAIHDLFINKSIIHPKLQEHIQLRSLNEGKNVFTKQLKQWHQDTSRIQLILPNLAEGSWRFPCLSINLVTSNYAITSGLIFHLSRRWWWANDWINWRSLSPCLPLIMRWWGICQNHTNLTISSSFLQSWLLFQLLKACFAFLLKIDYRKDSVYKLTMEKYKADSW